MRWTGSGDALPVQYAAEVPVGYGSYETDFAVYHSTTTTTYFNAPAPASPPSQGTTLAPIAPVQSTPTSAAFGGAAAPLALRNPYTLLPFLPVVLVPGVGELEGAALVLSEGVTLAEEALPGVALEIDALEAQIAGRATGAADVSSEQAAEIENNATIANSAGLTTAEQISIIREALSKKGNFGLNVNVPVTAAEAQTLGEDWVGTGYTVSAALWPIDHRLDVQRCPCGI